MIRLRPKRSGPIGVDIGSRSIKLVQFSADQSAVVDTSRWEWSPPTDADAETRRGQLVEAMKNAFEGRNFRGRNAVLCLSDRQLFLQNIRVPKAEGPALEMAVHQEIASRLPYPVEETDVKFWEAADIRQGETLLREVIVFACHRPILMELVNATQEAGLRPVAVDVEPAALLRSYIAQFRRDDERTQRTLIVHVGYSTTCIVIAQGEEALFIKYVDIGGRHMDECVSRALDMEMSAANALRRTQDDNQDAEVVRSLGNAVRPVAEKLVKEAAMCVRYHSVTFRGRPLERLLVGGGETSQYLVDLFAQRLAIPAEGSDPFRRIAADRERGRTGQWDVAAGLAMRDLTTGGRS